MVESVAHVMTWYQENRHLFDPPVCNKLMHKKQLTIMFVGGPNTRTDFHLDRGSEFFYMLKGNMELPTMQRGKRKLVKIREGEVFCLPSCVPHSPQRPEKGSLGLVVERERYKELGELDGLRWFSDFDAANEVIYEKYFHCWDLGRDLVPVVKEYHASEQKKNMKAAEDGSLLPDGVTFKIDGEVDVPDPFPLQDFLDANKEALARGEELNLFPGHPDGEFTVMIAGGEATKTTSFEYETWLYQMKGNATVTVGDAITYLGEGFCCIVPPNTEYKTHRLPESLGMVVTQDPRGNRARYEAMAGAAGLAVPDNGEPPAKRPK
eukprot:gnl/TRDRNA2_/TRDRNA2_194486_c0_seq1.p1 gnl/TRDRNA2_/TRDRNA2_194486_c0~~gnl/TRDRNA2_/TRDRNA2_194486_c0_seq1.p1  ORF type:complete len:343 (-),score=72.74 gnl/TRDRNA2_/TRDRNA2_194486_c0_seq1:50-1012(-)